MIEKEIEHLDVRQIAESGQVFRIREKNPGIWAIPAGGHYVEIRQQADALQFSCEEEEFEEFWKGYWDLELDYGAVKARIGSEDQYLTRASTYGWGIRILRQDLWEVIVTFLISQNNNMTRIRNSVEALCARFGEEKTAGGIEGDSISYHAFPTPDALAGAGLEGLAGSGLGYRDKYIVSMAEWCCSEEGKLWFERLKAAAYPLARELLLERCGVGNKVADCICLFGLHHVEAFPVDTHVKQIISSHYPDGFPFERYEGCAGIVQQYMFYYKVKEKA